MTHNQEETQTAQISNATPSSFVTASLSSIRNALRDFFRVRNEQDAMNEYLADSTDIYDLEARMRAWDARQRRNNYPF